MYSENKGNSFFTDCQINGVSLRLYYYHTYAIWTLSEKLFEIRRRQRMCCKIDFVPLQKVNDKVTILNNIMSKTFNIYCDESTHLIHDGHPYMLLGYTSIAYPQIKIAKEEIKSIKAKYNYKDELKWTNVHEATYKVYAELIDWFFMNDLEFRAVIVDKLQINESRPDYTFNDFYFRMYFQLLHTKVDFQNTYNVYLDIKDTCSSEKLETLNRIMSYNSSIGRLQFIRSHESVFIQLSDVLMGAINYNLRIEKGDVQGKVIAKLKLIDKIKKHSNISLSTTTPLSRKKFNLFFISLK